MNEQVRFIRQTLWSEVLWFVFGLVLGAGFTWLSAPTVDGDWRCVQVDPLGHCTLQQRLPMH